MNSAGGRGQMRSDPTIDLSVVVPVYNEQHCLPELYSRLTTVMRSIGRSYELIFVDDGSDDDSLASLRKFSEEDPHTRYISFTRNFGQSAALTAGQFASKGLGVITLDADLQNPPEEIPKLVAKFDEGYELVYGIRKNRKDPWVRRVGSRIITRFVKTSMHASLEPDLTAYMLTHRRLVDELNRCPERTRFHSALCAWLGARTTRVEVRHEKRSAGKSKYTYRQLLVRAFDLMTGFTHAPLRLAAGAGVAFCAAGFGLIAWTVAGNVIYAQTLLGWTSVMAAISIIGGLQLIALGVLGEFVGRAYAQLLGRPLFVVRETGRIENEAGVLRLPGSLRESPIRASSVINLQSIRGPNGECK